MTKKLFAVIMVCMFILSSLAVSSSKGIDIVTPFDKNKIMDLSENNDYKKPEFWGVLVGSNPYNDSVGEDAKKCVQNIKQILCEGGWKEDHIKLLTDQAKRRDLFDALSWLQTNVKPIDTVLICLYDHGLENSFCLYGGRVWYSEIGRRLDKIDCAGMAIIISACQSGTAMEFLRGYKRVIMTSSDIDTHIGFEDNLIEEGLKGKADTEEGIGNINGYVSIEELYNYYVKEQYKSPSYPLIPRLQDDYRWQLSLTFHNLSGVENQPPYGQLRPIGPTTGKKNTNYTFYVSAKDYDGDKIYYKFNWNDGNYSEWLGPYNSSEICEASHKWSKKGSYHVDVWIRDDKHSGSNYKTDTLRIDIARSKLDLKLEEFFDDYRIFYKMFSEKLGWNIGHL
jgi:PKD domain